MKKLLLNPEIIAIDQDPLGKPGGRRTKLPGSIEVWTHGNRHLARGRRRHDRRLDRRRVRERVHCMRAPEQRERRRPPARPPSRAAGPPSRRRPVVWGQHHCWGCLRRHLAAERNVRITAVPRGPAAGCGQRVRAAIHVLWVCTICRCMHANCVCAVRKFELRPV